MQEYNCSIALKSCALGLFIRITLYVSTKCDLFCCLQKGALDVMLGLNFLGQRKKFLCKLFC